MSISGFDASEVTGEPSSGMDHACERFVPFAPSPTMAVPARSTPARFSCEPSSRLKISFHGCPVARESCTDHGRATIRTGRWARRGIDDPVLRVRRAGCEQRSPCPCGCRRRTPRTSSPTCRGPCARGWCPIPARYARGKSMVLIVTVPGLGRARRQQVRSGDVLLVAVVVQQDARWRAVHAHRQRAEPLVVAEDVRIAVRQECLMLTLTSSVSSSAQTRLRILLASSIATV